MMRSSSSSNVVLTERLLLSLIFGAAALILVVGGTSSSRSSSNSNSVHHMLHICNRGFCFNKREEPLSPSAWHLAQISLTSSSGGGGGKKNKKRKRGDVVDFCSSSSSKQGRLATTPTGRAGGGFDDIDCELFSILGAERVDEEFEALECRKGVSCEAPPSLAKTELPIGSDSCSTTNQGDGEIISLDDLVEKEMNTRVSWKQKPLSGKCYNNDLDIEFDCNLVRIIDDAFLLISIEGGTLTTQPKANFTTKRSSKRRHKKKQRSQPSKTPAVLMTDDPFEDLRTVRAMNMEGF